MSTSKYFINDYDLDTIFKPYVPTTSYYNNVTFKFVQGTIWDGLAAAVDINNNIYLYNGTNWSFINNPVGTEIITSIALAYDPLNVLERQFDNKFKQFSVITTASGSVICTFNNWQTSKKLIDNLSNNTPTVNSGKYYFTSVDVEYNDIETIIINIGSKTNSPFNPYTKSYSSTVFSIQIRYDGITGTYTYIDMYNNINTDINVNNIFTKNYWGTLINNIFIKSGYYYYYATSVGIYVNTGDPYNGFQPGQNRLQINGNCTSICGTYYTTPAISIAGTQYTNSTSSSGLYINKDVWNKQYYTKVTTLPDVDVTYYGVSMDIFTGKYMVAACVNTTTNDNGQVYCSSDYGTTWQRILDPIGSYNIKSMSRLNENKEIFITRFDVPGIHKCKIQFDLISEKTEIYTSDGLDLVQKYEVYKSDTKAPLTNYIINNIDLNQYFQINPNLKFYSLLDPNNNNYSSTVKQSKNSNYFILECQPSALTRNFNTTISTSKPPTSRIEYILQFNVDIPKVYFICVGGGGGGGSSDGSNQPGGGGGGGGVGYKVMSVQKNDQYIIYAGQGGATTDKIGTTLQPSNPGIDSYVKVKKNNNPTVITPVLYCYGGGGGGNGTSTAVGLPGKAGVSSLSGDIILDSNGYEVYNGSNGTGIDITNPTIINSINGNGGAGGAGGASGANNTNNITPGYTNINLPPKISDVNYLNFSGGGGGGGSGTNTKWGNFGLFGIGGASNFLSSAPNVIDIYGLNGISYQVYGGGGGGGARSTTTDFKAGNCGCRGVVYVYIPYF